MVIGILTIISLVLYGVVHHFTVTNRLTTPFAVIFVFLTVMMLVFFGTAMFTQDLFAMLGPRLLASPLIASAAVLGVLRQRQLITQGMNKFTRNKSKS